MVNIISNIADKVGIATKEKLVEQDLLHKKDVDDFKEQLAKKEEVIATQQRLLKEAEDNKITEPSAIALDQVKRSPAATPGVKKKLETFQVLYYTNQFIFRGINIRANELVTRGYRIVGGSAKGRKKCEDLIKISGGDSFFRQVSVNTDVFGDGWIELLWNKKGSDILKLEHIHPATFGFRTDETYNSVLVDSKGEPVGYEQRVSGPQGWEKRIPVPKEKVDHVTFNKVGDEFTGISIIQPLYDTIVRLMNMEEAGAYSAVKTANPIWIGRADTKSPNELAKWASVLGRISGKDQVFIPKGMELTMESPKQTNFADYANYFLDAIVAGLGVPKPILLGLGEGSNRAVSVVQNRHFLSMIEFNQSTVETAINRIFKKYAEKAGFSAPELKFNEIMEDINVNIDSAIKLFEAGLFTREQALMLIGYEEGGVMGKQTITDAIKKSDMDTWHPAKPNSPRDGSQTGNKKEMKQNPDSGFKG